MANTVELNARVGAGGLDPDDPLMELSRIIGISDPVAPKAAATRNDPQLSVEDSFAMDLERELEALPDEAAPDFDLDIEQSLAEDLDFGLDLGTEAPPVEPSLEDELSALLGADDAQGFAPAEAPVSAMPEVQSDFDLEEDGLEPVEAVFDNERSEDTDAAGWLDEALPVLEGEPIPEEELAVHAGWADADPVLEQMGGRNVPAFDDDLVAAEEGHEGYAVAPEVREEADFQFGDIDLEPEFDSSQAADLTLDEGFEGALDEIAALDAEMKSSEPVGATVDMHDAPQFEDFSTPVEKANELERLVALTAPQPVVEALAEVPEAIESVDEFDIPDFEFSPEPGQPENPGFELGDDFGDDARFENRNAGAGFAAKAADTAPFADADFDFDAILDEELAANGDTFGHDSLTAGAVASGVAAAAAAGAVRHAPPLSAEPDLDVFRSDMAPEYMAEPRKNRMPLYAGAAVLALAVIGGAWWSFSGPSATTATGESVLVKADTEPVKVAPENPAGAIVPNQDKAVYDQVAGNGGALPGTSQLVSESEEPLDIAAATPADSAQGKSEARIDPGASSEAASGQAADTLAIAPKKVKTLIVKPDGTLVERQVEPAPADTATAGMEPATDAATPAPVDAANAGAAADDPAPETAEAPAQSAATQAPADQAPVAPESEAQATPEPVAAKPEKAVEPPIKVVKTKKIKAPAPQSQETAAAPPAEAGPVGDRPAEQPVTIVGQTGGQNAGGEQQVAAADPAPQAQTGAGGYTIQIASTPSPEAAKSTYAALTRKYGGVISGRGVNIQKAEVDGKGTVYRVRIPAGSKQEAASLCAKYKSAGGSCFVTK